MASSRSSKAGCKLLHSIIILFIFIYFIYTFGACTFGALTLLIGWKEEHLACKKYE